MDRSGAGVQNALVTNNHINNNGIIGCTEGQEVAGIYMGNGAQKNIISNNIIKGNQCEGILYFEYADNQSSSYNNSILNNQIVSNVGWGLRLVNMKRAIISNNQIILNEKGGIELANNSIGHLISSNNIILNGPKGIEPLDYEQDNTVSSNVIIN